MRSAGMALRNDVSGPKPDGRITRQENGSEAYNVQNGRIQCPTLRRVLMGCGVGRMVVTRRPQVISPEVGPGSYSDRN
jgi:hypothetical protein